MRKRTSKYSKPLRLGDFFEPSKCELAMELLFHIHKIWEISQTEKTRLKLKIKYMIKTLRSAANNPNVAAKLWQKKLRLDRDTVNLLGLHQDGAIPSHEMILDRLIVLEHYRKLHGNDEERLVCGYLREVHDQHGLKPHDPGVRRAFVVAVLTEWGIDFPDPAKRPGSLDEWMSMPITAISPEDHHMAAEQARALRAAKEQAENQAHP